MRTTDKKPRFKPAPALRRWLLRASPIERGKLALAARTKVQHLYQVAGGHRAASADMAVRLERAGDKLRVANRRLPSLMREQLAAACAGCELARCARRAGA